MRTLVIHPYLKHDRSSASRSPEARLQEAVRLTHAISLEDGGAQLVPLSNYRPATLIGQGKAEELAAFIAANEIGLCVVDGHVSPVQQRNLEKELTCKVIDRTALILEIFGARARTHEGKLQVELAALEYQKSRLVRSWTHLERQRGGFGFLGGPGESQIEIDRRLIRDRIAKIKRELEGVARTRELHRKKRRDVPYPVVALVGYTNAGKSTLFNRLTKSHVVAMDKLFATLDPTLRALKLPSGLQIILSDTVGFISDLPHELVAAFRATLEEVAEADLLLHVRDISHPDAEAQKADVLTVLQSLLDEERLDSGMVEVWNKIDQLPETTVANGAVGVSALTGQGMEGLFKLLDKRLAEEFLTTFTLRLPASDGSGLAWLYRHGTVHTQVEDEGILNLKVSLSPQDAARWHKMQKEM